MGFKDLSESNVVERSRAKERDRESCNTKMGVMKKKKKKKSFGLRDSQKYNAAGDWRKKLFIYYYNHVIIF